MTIDRETNYFDPDYLASRQKVTREYRELAEEQLPTPEKDWGIIWPLSGPDLTFEEDPTTAPEEAHKTVTYNQTKGRFETALNLAKLVTALRTNKDLKDITMADIEQAGPMIYWNGRAAHNNYLAEFVASGELEKRYNFPASKLAITANREIKHTDDQFEDFPINILPPGEKVIIVTDFYHLPRVKRYAQKYAKKLLPEEVVLYPAQPSRLPVKMAIQEIKKIHGYSQEGILPPDTDN
ncbi:hypothetical protein A3H10_00960 [Candidatus Uhrbacteria bacterium RIFCSPLOWO2_12_FULL_46_10]|uniref:DUF218 domain-containing protein n=1 Tax=Candidatus Uhrbacteria bacterium RIFCSPLOWO2_01_FULL_47_25 TaxID=1802402 RepID=A0A1F7UTW8_9BACT|nr:MAG: hypothetical protein UX68_C0010G0058 [Parcubacteria group bacterium GW2011_GWA2_46_9]OGL59274.1 MAG: hypothetical protein A2752_01225 [Candidatus Uhrbacteria bacterium RIFCSPHIGHO2_01_FULL_46_23]OGL68481.1 MAG: hypothetical protein A3D60_02590 [Candidatus Uhrbacteria bacterium RIFCSPHIGHO2_02_FULL_47_29]OGL75592.1 MAG: hypothetical protein A3E96_00945 [Candidatus Uhrbacteria bacterium RIFCSPHIGHO2_12_FULL_46_13]OGL81107.1 MAG: hypothetical protein A2936_00710 [Candidatus Uhrbacteria bac